MVLTSPPLRCQDTLGGLLSLLPPTNWKISHKNIGRKPSAYPEHLPQLMWPHLDPRLAFGVALLEAQGLLSRMGFQTLILSLRGPRPPDVALSAMRTHPVTRVSIATCGMGVSTQELVHGQNLSHALGFPMSNFREEADTL